MTASATLLAEGPVTTRHSTRGLVMEQDLVYRVIADTVSQDRIEILQTATNLPQAMVTLTASGMQCKNVVLNPDPNHRLHYIATANFSSEVQENTDPLTPQAGDPVDWVPQAEVEFEPAERVVTKDINGTPYLNTVGDPFETGLIIPERIPTRVFTQFENIAPSAPVWQASKAYRYGQYVTNGANIYQCVLAGTSAASGGPTGTDPSLVVVDGTCGWTYQTPPPGGAVTIDQIEARCDTINSTEFLGRAAKTLLLEVRRATIGRYYGYRVWRIEYAMKYNKRTWTHKQLNMGWRYKDVSDSEHVLAGGKFYFIEPTTGMQYLGKLNEDGTKCADQLNDDPFELEFDVYEELDFNDFLKCV